MPVGEAPLSNSTDAGQNLSLADTSAHAFATSVPTQIGVMVCCPSTNTAVVCVACAAGLTTGATGTAMELAPGDREFFPVNNPNKLFCRTATATQNVHALAL